jgi:hypothetical protein
MSLMMKMSLTMSNFELFILGACFLQSLLSLTWLTLMSQRQIRIEERVLRTEFLLNRFHEWHMRDESNEKL